VLLDFAAPGQLRLLAGLEHGRTIPLAVIELGKGAPAVTNMRQSNDGVFAALHESGVGTKRTCRPPRPDVRLLRSSGLNADVALGPLLTQTGPKARRNPAAQRAPDLILANPLCC
jgi:hypothetical protein